MSENPQSREARRAHGSVSRFLGRLGIAGGCVVAALAVASPAAALQPLGTFLDQADAHNPDNREALATSDQRDAEARAALGRLLPDFTARGVYTRNQREVTLDIPAPPPAGAPAGTPTQTVTLTLTPLNQLDGFFQLDVPIFDPGNFGRYRAARATAEASKATGEVTKLDTRKQIVRAYYQVLGAAALVTSAEQSLAVAKKNADYVRDRRSGGVASDLDFQRATAAVEQAEQAVADAGLTSGLAARSLESLTGVAPTAAVTLPPDDLHDEGPLSAWITSGADLPRARSVVALSKAAQANRDAAKLALLPTLAAAGAEHVTNAPGFTGTSFFTATATLSWRIDYTLVANIQAQNAAVAAARARQDKVTRSAEDDVYEAWLRVSTGIAKSRSARAQADAATQAAQIAADRYSGGLATQLDVITAQRDAFAAAVLRVAADADLESARVILQISAGRPIPDRQRNSP